MKSISQVAKLTGVSIRTLQYYDEIGLLKPSKLTAAGYRMYDDNALQTLQQILFFKELGFKTESLTGREDIEQYVKGGEWKTVRLVEMLYCHRGCHNGDGVVKDEA